MKPLPWRALVAFALVGAAAVAGLTARDLAKGHSSIVSLIQPGVDGPAAKVIEHDFPGIRMPDWVGNDGQQFYAIARDPFRPRTAAASLDRPRYRLQRPLLPLLAWALHPSGGGRGLVWALALVNVLAIVLGGIAVGALAVTFGRSPRWALAFAALPGAYMSLRISTADALAVALALAAIALLVREHDAPAVAVAVLAVLAKESTIVLLAGAALPLWRTRRGAAMRFLGLPVAAAGAWWVVLRLTIANHGMVEYGEIVTPLRGWLDAAKYWVGSHDLKPAANAVVAITAALIALRAAPRGRWAPAIALQLGVLTVLSAATLSAWTHDPRTLLPLTSLVVVAAATRPQRVAT